MTPPKGLKVRGVCARCQTVVDTVAPKGRVTWRGKCLGEGCHRTVIARRVKPADGEPAPEPKTDDKPGGRRRARRVTTYDDAGPDGTPSVGPPQGRPAARRPTGGDPDEHDYREPAVDPVSGAPEHGPPQQRPHRAERADHQEHRERVIPVLGIFG